MARKCCVPFCRSNYRTATDGYVTVFSFPNDPHRRQQWLRSINRDNFQLGTTAVVCISHFSEQHIVRQDEAVRSDGSVLVMPRKIPKLTNDAVPSKFLKRPSYLQKIIPVGRRLHIGIVEDLKARRNSSDGTYLTNSFHCEKVKVETFEAFPSVDSETVNIKSEDITSNSEVEIKCEPNFDGEDDPLNASDISPNYEGEMNCQMNSSYEDDPLSTHKTSFNEECETKYQVSVKNEDLLNTLDVPLTEEVKVECQSYKDFH